MNLKFFRPLTIQNGDCPLLWMASPSCKGKHEAIKWFPPGNPGLKRGSHGMLVGTFFL
jgi:hypothetical protein